MRSAERINRRRPRRSANKRVPVVTEGIRTEVQYLQGIVQFLRASGVSVRATATQGVGKDPLHVLREARRLMGDQPDEFDSVWILVDVDQHATLNDCLRAALRLDVHALVSNPCFEIWLLWHYENMDRHQSSDWLRRRLRDLGHDGKTVPPNFPFLAYSDAIARATGPGRETERGTVGTNPSSALPVLIAHLHLQQDQRGA